MYPPPSPHHYHSISHPQYTAGTYNQHNHQHLQHGYAPPMGNPSIRHNLHFHPDHTASMLHEAIRGLGCDKNRLMQALIQCNNEQRQLVVPAYKQMYGEDLHTKLRSKLFGQTHFKELVLALMELPWVYDAQQLRRAMDRVGTKEHVLIEIMTTRSNAQIYHIKAVYKQLYNIELEEDIVRDTSGHFRKLLRGLCAGNRDESGQTNMALADRDAYRLYRAGTGRLGTDEAAFQAILATQNYAQVLLLFDTYHKMHGKSIESVIKSEFSGDIRDAHLALVKSIRNRPAFFAEQIFNTMDGLGTRDNDLIRLVVTRSEVDLIDIANIYPQMYGRKLVDHIHSETSGNYRDALIGVVLGRMP